MSIVTDVGLIAAACAGAHQSHGDHVTLSAYLAARTSEVAGLVIGNVDITYDGRLSAHGHKPRYTVK